MWLRGVQWVGVQGDGSGQRPQPSPTDTEWRASGPRGLGLTQHLPTFREDRGSMLGLYTPASQGKPPGRFSRAWARQAVLPFSTRSQISFGGEKAVGCQATNQRLQPPHSLLGSPAFLPTQNAQDPHRGRSGSNSRSGLVPQTCLPSTAPSQLLLHWNLVDAKSSHFIAAETEPWGKTVSSIHLEGGPFSHPCSTPAVAAGPPPLLGRGGD